MGDIHLGGQSTHGEAATEQPPQKETSACTQTSAKHRTAKAQKYHHWTSPVPTTLQSKDLKNQSQSLAGSCAALSFRKINRWLMWLQTSCTLYHQCSLGRDKKKKKKKLWRAETQKGTAEQWSATIKATSTCQQRPRGKCDYSVEGVGQQRLWD